MDVIDKITESQAVSAQKRGLNRYPRIELEKSIHLDKFFSEKAASKK